MENLDIQAIVNAVLKEIGGGGGGGQACATCDKPADKPAVSADAGEGLEDLGLPKFKRWSGVHEPKKPEVLKEFIKATGARLGVGRVGPRPLTTPYLRFLADHSRSKGTVFKEVPDAWLEKNKLKVVHSQAGDKDTYLTRPDLGRKLTEESVAELKKLYPTPPKVQVVLSDGLSTDALLVNYEEILPPLMNGLKNAGISAGEPLFLRHGRVKAEDVIGEAVGCEVLVLLIGERPGLGQSESMSCYAVYKPTVDKTVESDRTVVSNIHSGGTPPVEAAAVIVDLVKEMLAKKASGIALTQAKS